MQVLATSFAHLSITKDLQETETGFKWAPGAEVLLSEFFPCHADQLKKEASAAAQGGHSCWMDEDKDESKCKGGSKLNSIFESRWALIALLFILVEGPSQSLLD